MYRTILTPILLILSILSFAQTNPAEGAKLLFTNVKSSLSIADKNLIYKNLGFKLSKDKTQFVSMEDEGSEFPFTAQVFPSDLNKDGKEDIFVVYGNSYTSGQTGSSVVLYIKKADGSYSTNPGFPGTAPEVMPTINKGYPDLIIGGPGFEFPIWRWNGKEYAYFNKVKDQDLPKMKTKNIEEVSKIYQSQVKTTDKQ